MTSYVPPFQELPLEVIQPQPRTTMHANMLIGVCVLAAAGVYFSGSATLLRLALPVLAMIVALALYLWRPLAYLPYVLWVWFLTPLVRRLVDLRFGFAEPNFVLLAPLLASSVAGWTLVRAARAGRLREISPFLLCILGVVYGFVVGMLQHPTAEVAFGLFDWLCPLFLGLHIALNWEDVDRYWRAASKTFVWATLLLGLYAVWQYINPPAWDVYWLTIENEIIAISSFGYPQPFMVRVWGTLNSPGPFANVMVVGLLLLIATRSKLKIPASIAGFVALLLSVVRTSWLSWMVGMVFLLVRSKPKVFARLLISTLLILACVAPALNDPRAAFLVKDRLDTFQHLSKDGSYEERSEMYKYVTAEIATNPFGQGLKNGVMVHGYVIDSGFLAMLIELGWFGTLFFAAGLGALLLVGAGRGKLPEGPHQVSLSICVAMLAQMLGGLVFVSVSGMLFWVFAGFFVSSKRKLSTAAAVQSELAWEAYEEQQSLVARA